MAKSVLDWKTRRNVSENPKTTPEALIQAAETLIGADRLAEAIDLLQKAGDQERLAKIRSLAVEEGNLFLYVRCCQAAGLKAPATELKALADRAGAAGLALYESRARAIVDDGSGRP